MTLNRARSGKKKALKLLGLNRHSDALPLLEAVCRSSPRDGEAWLMLGAIHGHLGNIQAAIQCSEQAVALMPASIQALDNLALGYQHASETSKACSTWERRLSLDPGNRDTVCRLAQGLMSTGQTDKAITIYQQYLEKSPTDYELHTNLGIAYELEGSLSQAENSYRRTLDLKPKLSVALQNLANILSAQGKTDTAIDTYRAALESDPKNAIARSNFLLNLHYKPEYTTQEIYHEHVKYMSDACIETSRRTFKNNLDVQRPLNIGFVSPDMRTHSVAYFFEALLQSMDGTQYISYCYADVAKSDATTARLRSLSSHWRDVAGMSIVAISNRIRNDNIDILIDLAGHTSPRNMAVFAARLAPLQITWLGYPNTTGLRCIDYRITDSHADPLDSSTPGTETLVRLEDCFLCYKPLPGTPDVSALPAKKNGFITFGSFNNLAKINDRVLELWAKLLERVAGAHLYLKNPSFTDKATRNAYRQKLIDLGVSGDRISLIGRTRTPEEHLELYSEIDISLDTFPYNGTTTSCEALWMGIPVVTKAANAHAGRVGASLLNAINHTGWIGKNDEDYLQIATRLAADIDMLANIRSTLRDNISQSPLCDTKHFATRFQHALRKAWTGYCESATG